jgi:hypothetical protein
MMFSIILGAPVRVASCDTNTTRAAELAASPLFRFPKIFSFCIGAIGNEPVDVWWLHWQIWLA